MSILRKRLENKKVIIGVALALVMILSVISVVSVNNTEKASGSSVQYNNKVFTKKLYKDTEKIGFGSDGSQIIKDKKTVKKVYTLLAKMKLRPKVLNLNGAGKDGFVTVVIHTKNGKKKTYTFQGKEMDGKYIITKNHPIDKIREIYDESED